MHVEGAARNIETPTRRVWYLLGGLLIGNYESQS